MCSAGINYGYQKRIKMMSHNVTVGWNLWSESTQLLYFASICKYYFFFWSFLRAVPGAYGSSQRAKGQIKAAAASLSHSRSNTKPKLPLWHTPQLEATPDPLTHWAMPGIKPTSSWILVGYLTHWATMGTVRYNLHEGYDPGRTYMKGMKECTNESTCFLVVFWSFVRS